MIHLHLYLSNIDTCMILKKSPHQLPPPKIKKISILQSCVSQNSCIEWQTFILTKWTITMAIVDSRQHRLMVKGWESKRGNGKGMRSKMIMKERECKGLTIDNHGLIFLIKFYFIWYILPHGLHLYLNFYKYYFICISYQIVLGFCIITCATNMLTNGNYCQILERKISFIQVQLKLCNIAVFMCCLLVEYFLFYMWKLIFSDLCFILILQVRIMDILYLIIRIF